MVPWLSDYLSLTAYSSVRFFIGDCPGGANRKDRTWRDTKVECPSIAFDLDPGQEPLKGVAYGDVVSFHAAP
jgi:hypothetical protein